MQTAQQKLRQSLFILEGLSHKAVILNNSGEHNSDLQKAIVGIIRGSEFAFEELTGVKYQESNYKRALDHQQQDTIPN